jgi:hypothetical protein
MEVRTVNIKKIRKESTVIASEIFSSGVSLPEHVYNICGPHSISACAGSSLDANISCDMGIRVDHLIKIYLKE